MREKNLVVRIVNENYVFLENSTKCGGKIKIKAGSDSAQRDLQNAAIFTPLGENQALVSCFSVFIGFYNYSTVFYGVFGLFFCFLLITRPNDNQNSPE